MTLCFASQPNRVNYGDVESQSYSRQIPMRLASELTHS